MKVEMMRRATGYLPNCARARNSACLMVALLAGYVSVASGRQDTTRSQVGRGVGSERAIWDEPRLKAPVSLSGMTVVGQGIPDILHRATGLSFILETSLLTRPLPEVLDGQPAGEVLEAMAERFRARWQRFGDTYTLVAEPKLLPLLRLTPTEWQQRVNAEFERLTQSLHFRQTSTLRKRGDLSLDGKETTRLQRPLLVKLGWLAVASPFIQPSAGVTDGQGFRLRLTGGATGSELQLLVSQAGRQDYRMAGKEAAAVPP